MGAIGGGMVVAAQIFALPLSDIFVGYDMTLFKMTVHALRISTISFLIVGFNILRLPSLLPSTTVVCRQRFLSCGHLSSSLPRYCFCLFYLVWTAYGGRMSQRKFCVCNLTFFFDQGKKEIPLYVIAERMFIMKRVPKCY